MKAALLFPFALLLLAACGPKPTPVVNNAVFSPAGEAPVESVEILSGQQGANQIRLLVRGTLPDECTRLSEPQVATTAESVDVVLVTEELNSSTCSGIALLYERVVSVDTSSLTAGDHVASVNGINVHFTIPSTNEAAVVAANSPAAISNEAADKPALETTSEEPIPAPVTGGEETEVAVQEASSESACEDKAAFFGDVTIPDNTVLEPGESFVKTWKVRNEGSCTWGEGYALVFENGEQMGVNKSISMPTVEPGQVVDLSVDMTAPTGIGKFTSNWQFQNPSGKRFGVNSSGKDLIWVTIVTNADPPPAEPPGSTSACAADANTTYVQEIVQLINAERTGRGLSALQWDDRLASAANGHSLDMACNDFLDHYGYNGSTWYDRIASQGYSYGAASENIYAGNPAYGGNASGSFTWWMNSQIHRDAILSPKFTAFGVGYAFRSSSTYGGYFTVVFAKGK